MATIKTGKQHRAMEFERASLDAEARTVALTFSSEYPVERYFGTEVLDHSPSSIRLGRLRNKGPVLIDHNNSARDLVGCVEAVEIGDDRIGRAIVRFGSDADSDAIFSKVRDGILSGVSVGYVIHKLQQERAGDQEIMRAVDWEPIEISLVPVQADPTSHVMRADNSVEIETEVIGRDVADEATTVVVDSSEIAGSAIDVRDEAVIEVVENATATTQTETRKDEIMSQVDMTADEVKQYSYARAIAAALARAEGQNVSGFEVEVSQDIESKLPANTRSHGGIYVPMNLKRAALATSLYNTATKGAETVFTEPGELIDMLRNQSVAVRLGARVMGGLNGPVSFPKQLTAATAYWMPENDGTDVTASNSTLGSVTLTPKTLQATTAYSRQLVAQSTIDVEQFIRQDLAAVHALAWDQAVLHGAGSSNEPTGLYAVSGINSVAMGGVPTFGKLIDMATEVNKDNALAGNLAFLTTPGMAGKLAQTVVAASTDTRMIWGGNLLEGNLAGFRAVSSNQVKATLGGGSEHGLLFGDWSQAMIGMWGAMEIIVDPYALKKQGMIEITSFQLCDIAFRQVTAFCKATGATIA